MKYVQEPAPPPDISRKLNYNIEVAPLAVKRWALFWLMEDKVDGTLPRRGSWAKRILIVFAGLAALLLVAYFVVTSSAFFKSVILPKAGAALNAKIEVRDASISPFSQVALRGLRMQTTGTEPLLTAEEVRLRYSLMDIIRGKINVQEVTLVSPVVQIIEEADGSSNLDPLLKDDEEKEEEKPDSKETKQLSIQNVSLKDGIVRQMQKLKEGGTNLTEIKGLNIALDRLGNGQSGKLSLAGDLTMSQLRPGTNDLLEAKISGGYDIALDNELMPETVKGSTQLSVGNTRGNYADLAGLSASLDADLTPTEIRQVALRFMKGGQNLGLARVSGPLDLNKKEGQLKVEVVAIDRNVLNIAGAARGWDFKQSTINSTNQIQLAQNGSFIAASGNLAGRQISIAQQETTTPPLDLNLDYQISVNLAQKSAVLQKLNLAGQSNGKDLLRSSLDRQMNITWGGAAQGFREASLRLILTNLNIAEWRPVLGTNLTSGDVSAQMALVAQQDGRLLSTDLSATIANLSAQFGSNRIQNAVVALRARGTVEEMKMVNLPEYSLILSMRNERALQAGGTLRYNLENNDTGAQLSAEAALPALLTLISVPDLQASSGLVKVTANYSGTGDKKQAQGNLTLEKFTGTRGDFQFQDFRQSVEYNVGIQGEKIDIRRASVSFGQGFNAGGTLDLTGNYDLEKKSGQFTFKAVDLNENLFRPLLGPSLGENVLVSIDVDGSGTAALNPAAESAIKAEVKVSNWVVQDKAGTLPKQPLSVAVALDGGMREETLDLRRLLVQLSPTSRAKNELLAQGKLDLAKTNAGPSTLSLQSESLDVTPYYNMFAGGSEAEAAGAQTKSGAATPAGAGQASPEQKEPEPMELPVKQLTADLKVDRFYLRQIAISNWTGKVAIQSNVVRLDPFQMTVNGGGVKMTANVDVGTPGYRYEFGFGSDNVPLEPLANSLGDTNKAGQLKGTLVANARIAGAGITGPSLRKNLNGNADLNLTNINYQIVGPKIRRIMVPIALALGVPELTGTPIDWVAAKSEIRNGQVVLQPLHVRSEAFYAQGQGAIALADVLTNSTLNIPLDISLRRSLAVKSRLASATVATNLEYVPLPRFVTVRGTLGEPGTDINKLAIAGLLAKTAANLGVGSEKTEEILGTVGNILGGQRGTNVPGTNQGSAAGNLLRGLGGLLGGQQQATNAPQGKTNAPGTNAPRSNPLDLLNPLLKRD